MRRTNFVDAAMVCGLALTAGMTLACSSPPVGAAPLVHVVDTNIPECPHDYQSIRIHPVDSVASPAGDTTLNFGSGFTVAKVNTNVPEFNDCQKIVESSGNYGPVMGIFAPPELRTMTFPRSGRGVLVPAAAEILSFAPTPDGNALGIKPLFNCLYMWRDEQGLTARMVPVGDQEPKCGNQYDTSRPLQPGETPLTVYAKTANGFSSPDDYPAVARWDYDLEHKIQYIGLKCEAAWCEIGPARRSPSFFTPSPAYIDAAGRGSPTPSTASAPPTADDKIRAIKGWYDQQYLMTKDGTRPSGVKGTVFPDSATGGLTLSSYTGHWKLSAYVALEAPNTEDGHSALVYYKSKFNLDSVPPQSHLKDMNRIELCFGTVWDCLPNVFQASISKSCAKGALWHSSRNAIWWTRIVSRSTGSSMYRCVTRRPDPINAMPGMTAKTMPATARWRWLLQDETIWDECVVGCCQIGQDLF